MAFELTRDREKAWNGLKDIFGQKVIIVEDIVDLETMAASPQNIAYFLAPEEVEKLELNDRGHDRNPYDAYARDKDDAIYWIAFYKQQGTRPPEVEVMEARLAGINNNANLPMQKVGEVNGIPVIFFQVHYGDTTHYAGITNRNVAGLEGRMKELGIEPRQRHYELKYI